MGFLKRSDEIFPQKCLRGLEWSYIGLLYILNLLSEYKVGKFKETYATE